MSNELKPCPFCGCHMRMWSNRDWHRITGEHDEQCVFMEEETILVPATDDQRVLAIADWNRRAQPAEAEGVEVVAAFVYDNDMLLCVEFDPKARMGTADGTALVRQSDHLAALSALSAERDALRPDAERYRYLRNTAKWPEAVDYAVEDGSPGQMDAAIDAALSALSAERDEWKARCQYNAETAYDVAAERDQLRTQVEALRKALEFAVREQSGDLPTKKPSAWLLNARNVLAETTSYD